MLKCKISALINVYAAKPKPTAEQRNESYVILCHVSTPIILGMSHNVLSLGLYAELLTHLCNSSVLS